MSIKSYLAPEIVKTFRSKFNTNVQLVNFSGKLRLDMGGLTQSGQIIEKIWSKAFTKLLPPNLKPKKILILGLGAASAAKVIEKKWPGAKMVGVEIDPMVIKIAKQYFKANEISNLKIINQDAAKFIKQVACSPEPNAVSVHTCFRPHENGEKIYDLILVDCYQGYKIPPIFEEKKFLMSLGKIGKIVLINRLFWSEHKQKTISFLKKLSSLFATSTCRTPSNLIIKV